ncbi:MAG: lysophospholipase [Leptospiraceae bacterium]|nr:lysophospholipase [Leptospiraceae bacterium]
MSFANKQSSFQSSIDGTNIFFQSWTKPDSKKVLVIQHGFGEHSDRYGNILSKLEKEDYNIYALDSRGHGRSDGIRGHVDQFQRYIDDLADLIRIAKKEKSVEKVTLLGHSLGGVISLQYATEGFNQDNLEKLIISSPALKVRMDFEKQVKKLAAEVLSSFLPAVTLDANLDVGFLSHDPEVIKAYQNDPLVHGKVSFQMGKNLFHLAEAMYDKAHLIQVPILIIHGEEDGIADVEGAREFFKRLTAKEKDLKVYNGLFHELMNETQSEREVVLKDVIDFLKQN